MEALGAVAGVANVVDAVAKLSGMIYRFQNDYKLADEDLDAARQHALLLQQEIRALEREKTWTGDLPCESAKRHNSALDMDGASFTRAMNTARNLLSDIEEAFPLRSEPHTWRSKVRWAIKDKKALSQLKERLHSTESTLQGFISMEQLRITQTIYRVLLQQRSTLEGLKNGNAIGNNVINMAVINQANAESKQTIIQAQLSEVHDEPTLLKAVTKAGKAAPWAVAFQQWGFSARLISVPKEDGTRYKAGIHMTLFGKMYSVQLHVNTQDYSLWPMMNVRNTVTTDSDMAVACKSGDFNTAQRLLSSGMARGSDVTAGGWPLLDYAIESGSTRLVRLLLDHGAEPDLTYGEHHMTALQSSFLRGNLDIARVLLNQGADIEHVDNDGYSVLSYLWVHDGHAANSFELMRLCIANGFTSVNSSDDRGWTPLHRAAAVGSSQDVEAFLRLGASLDQRADWYGWNALFFAGSHDNVDTFKTILEHSGSDALSSLDGDGWNLLHCCIYFGAPRVMRLAMRGGIDVNLRSLPAPLPEDPELSYRELTPRDVAIYMGPNRYRMFMDALVDTGRFADLEVKDDVFWDAAAAEPEVEAELCHVSDESRRGSADTMYGAEDFDEKWALLHWASYNGSAKVRQLLLLKGAAPEHLEAIMMEDNQTLLPIRPFEER